MKRYKKPYRVRRKKSILRNRFFRSGVLSAVFLSVLSYFLFFSGVFEIKEVAVAGAKKVPKNEITALLSVKNIFLVNSEKLKKDILDKFPELAEVEIKRQFPGTLSVLAQERVEKAVWCREAQCFFVDERGVIFQSEGQKDKLLRIFTRDELLINPKAGQQLLDEDAMRAILRIQEDLKKNLQIPIAGISVVSASRLNAEIPDGWKIFFNPQKDIDWQLAKLTAVLEGEIPQQKRKNLEYIDLRFGNLASYKYR